MTMDCNIRRKAGVTILDLSGRLSLAEVVAESGVVLGDRIRKLTKKGEKKILLNLAEVTYVDSSGVGQLTGAYTTARNQGADLKLLNPTHQLQELLIITRLDKLFDIKYDEATAIKSFAEGAAAQA